MSEVPLLDMEEMYAYLLNNHVSISIHVTSENAQVHSLVHIYKTTSISN